MLRRKNSKRRTFIYEIENDEEEEEEKLIFKPPFGVPQCNIHMKRKFCFSFCFVSFIVSNTKKKERRAKVATNK